MEPINVLWLMCKESPGPTQTPCKHWVFATDGYDLKIDIPTAMKFARSIADQFPGQTLGHMQEATPKTVLIVEDHELNRMLFHALLQMRGYNILEAAAPPGPDCDGYPAAWDVRHRSDKMDQGR